MIGLGNTNINSKPTPPSSVNIDGSTNWNKNGYSSKKILDQLTDQDMKDQVMQGATIGDLVKQYLPEAHQALAKRLVSYYGESSDDIIDYLNSAAGGEDALKQRARGFATNIAANGHTKQFADTFKNIFGGSTANDVGLTQSSIDAISGGTESDVWKKRVEELSNQKNQYIQGAIHAAGQNAYLEKQKILETQRKYGITGAVASAQMQDYELKNRQAISDTQLKASAQWEQLNGANYNAAETSLGLTQVKEKQGWLKQVADGKFGNSQQAINALKTMGVSDDFRSKMTDDIVNDLLKNKSHVSTIMNGQANTHAAVTPTK